MPQNLHGIILLLSFLACGRISKGCSPEPGMSSKTLVLILLMA